MSTTVEYFIRKATRDIIILITRPPKHTALVLHLGNTIRNFILQVTNLLNINQVTPTIIHYEHRLTSNTLACLYLIHSLPASNPSLVPIPEPSPVLTLTPSLKPCTFPILTPSLVPSAKPAYFSSLSLSNEYKE